jgi:hypothetical protein
MITITYLLPLFLSPCVSDTQKALRRSGCPKARETHPLWPKRRQRPSSLIRGTIPGFSEPNLSPRRVGLVLANPLPHVGSKDSGHRRFVDVVR